MLATVLALLPSISASASAYEYDIWSAGGLLLTQATETHLGCAALCAARGDSGSGGAVRRSRRRASAGASAGAALGRTGSSAALACISTLNRTSEILRDFAGASPSWFGLHQWPTDGASNVGWHGSVVGCDAGDGGYTAWLARQPNDNDGRENCAAVRIRTGAQWVDAACSIRLHCLCELGATPTAEFASERAAADAAAGAWAWARFGAWLIVNTTCTLLAFGAYLSYLLPSRHDRRLSFSVALREVIVRPVAAAGAVAPGVGAGAFATGAGALAATVGALSTLAAGVDAKLRGGVGSAAACARVALARGGGCSSGEAKGDEAGGGGDGGGKASRPASLRQRGLVVHHHVDLKLRGASLAKRHLRARVQGIMCLTASRWRRGA